jgi:hypothetical protein
MEHGRRPNFLPNVAALQQTISSNKLNVDSSKAGVTGETTMKNNRLLATPSILLLSLSLYGCGTFAPQIGEIWDDESNAAHTLEMKIKQKIYCELQSAVSHINDPTYRPPFRQFLGDKELKPAKPLPESWGVQMQLFLTVEENSSLNPGVAFNTPIIPGNTRFPSNIIVQGPQAYALSLGGTLSSDATRTDKFSFYYLVKDLEGDQPACNQDKFDQEDLHGSSFLLESDLGIYKWLNNAMNIRSSVGTSEPGSSQQEVMSYDIKFDVVSSGNITPTWKLVRVTANGTGNFFSTKRERTHEIILTFGPTAQPTSQAKAKPTPSAKAKLAKPEPGLLAAQSALASEIGASVANSLNRLSPQ